MPYFMNPLAIERAGQHLVREREKGRKSLPQLGSLALLLNACYAAAVGGLVHVSQTYLGSRCGGAGVRSVRNWENELVAAGLLERVGDPGRRRVLRVLDPEPSYPQVIHNKRTPTPAESDSGTMVPVSAEPRCRYRSAAPEPPNKDRARVSQEPSSRIGGDRARDLADFNAAVRALAVAVRASIGLEAEIRLEAEALTKPLGVAGAALAVRQVTPWVLREAKADPGALAVQAIRARARRTQGPKMRQGGLFS